MSFLASVLRAVYKLSGAKKSFALPEDKLLQELEKQNRAAAFLRRRITRRTTRP